MNVRTRLVLVLLLLSLALMACGLPSLIGKTQPPEVSIAAPADGQQIQSGTQVEVISASTDAQGVTRVELWVDGVLFHTEANPAPAANALFSTRQVWQATDLGARSLMVIAYNAGGVSSTPATVNVTVVGGAGDPPPSGAEPTAAVGAAPTATWTPISVSPQDSPAPPPTNTSPPAATVPPPTATNQPPPGGKSDDKRPSAPGPITGFEEFGDWRRGDQANGTFTQSTEQVHGGAYAGKLAYSFPTADNDFVVFMQTYKLGGQPNQISAWVYGDGNGHYLNAWIVDAQGETWQFPLGKIKHNGWQQMSAWLNPADPWPAGHIDGPANGALDYPIDFRALVLDDVPDSFVGNGVVYIDDLGSAVALPPTATPPTPPSPTPGTPAVLTTPTLSPPSGTPSVNFWADAYAINDGDCTRLRWEVENVREVYLDDQGVVGIGKKKVCPTGTTTYTLKVVHLDSSVSLHTITISVVTP